jgi:hypothetical protein
LNRLVVPNKFSRTETGALCPAACMPKRTAPVTGGLDKRKNFAPGASDLILKLDA